MKWLVILMIPTAAVSVYLNGYLDAVVKSPALRASLVTFEDASRPYLLRLSEHAPFFAQWISPIPSIDDVTAEDYEELKAAAGAKLNESGPKVAFALSRSDLFTPSFQVASNLPDGTQLEIFVEGIPDTLLNHMSFQAQTYSTILNKLGKSGPIRFSDAKPIPRGEYIVHLMEAESQPETTKAALSALPASNLKTSSELPKGKKLILKKTYFLGGVRDAIYTARLKEFHDKLMARATTELNEVKQFSTTLESQWLQSTELFQHLRKGKVIKAQQKSWMEFHAKWLKLDKQLNETFQTWTPQVLQNDIFYTSLYELTRQTGQSVARMHGLHHAYFTGAVDSKSFDIQLGEASSFAQTSLSELKTKIERVEKTPPTPNGMPKKDGL